MTRAISQSSPMRDKPAHGHHRVTFVELFFDLVFVFAITQISHTLLAHFTVLGVVETAMMMLAIWWVWIYTTWVANWLDPEHTRVRLLMFGLMLLGLALSTSIPKAFESRGLAFALAYVAMQVGRTLFFIACAPPEQQAQRRNFQRILAWFCLSALFWISGGLAEGGWRVGLWCVALALEYVSPALRFWTPGLGSSSLSDWTVEGGHLSERCALLVMIVTGAMFSSHDWDAPIVTAFLLAFIGSVAMWWIYFDKGAEEGSERIAASEESGRLARVSYTYIHLLIIAGIIVSAVSDELALAHPLGHVEAQMAIATIGGPLLFLVGCLLFKKTIRGWFMLSHLVGVAALLLLAFFYGTMPPLVFYGLTTAILCVVAAWETLSLRGRRGI